MHVPARRSSTNIRSSHTQFSQNRRTLNATRHYEEPHGRRRTAERGPDQEQNELRVATISTRIIETRPR